MLAASYLQIDETPIKVPDKSKAGTAHRGFYWVYHDPLKKMVFFDYQQGRGREGPVKMLKDFSGYIDNNGVENSLRPIAIGKKNYLFAGSHHAAYRSGMLYSLLGTCKMHSINPHTWFKDVLQRIASYPINKIHQLLPHHWVPSHSHNL